MRKTIIFFTLLISWTVEGQIVNNLSTDKTNIYIHAIDSVTRIIILEESLAKIYVYGDTPFPNEIEGIKFQRGNETKKIKKDRKTKNGEARFFVSDIKIIRDQFKITIYTFGPSGILGEGAYVFDYKYIPSTMTYELKEIEKGIVL